MAIKLEIIPAPWVVPSSGDISIVTKLRRKQKQGMCCRRTPTIRLAYRLALYLHLSGSDECAGIIEAIEKCQFHGNYDQWHYVECALVLHARRLAGIDSEARFQVLSRIRAAGYVEARTEGVLLDSNLVEISSANKLGLVESEVAGRENLCTELMFILAMRDGSRDSLRFKEMFEENLLILRNLVGITYRGKA